MITRIHTIALDDDKDLTTQGKELGKDIAGYIDGQLHLGADKLTTLDAVMHQLQMQRDFIAGTLTSSHSLQNDDDAIAVVDRNVDGLWGMTVQDRDGRCFLEDSSTERQEAFGMVREALKEASRWDCAMSGCDSRVDYEEELCDGCADEVHFHGLATTMPRRYGR